MPIIKNCLICGKEFKTLPCHIRRGHGNYCSIACSKKYRIGPNKGKKFSVETRKKMSDSKKGKRTSPNSEFKKGHTPSHFLGVRNTSSGYILIFSPKHPCKNNHKYVREHRLVIEKKINRFLKPFEKVHHLNEIKTDNHPKNLICFTSESAHQRFHKSPLTVKPEEIIFDGRIICTC